MTFCLIKSLHLEQKAAFPDRRSSSTTLTFSQMDLGTYIQEIKGHSDLHWDLNSKTQDLKTSPALMNAFHIREHSSASSSGWLGHRGHIIIFCSYVTAAEWRNQKDFHGEGKYRIDLFISHCICQIIVTEFPYSLHSLRGKDSVIQQADSSADKLLIQKKMQLLTEGKITNPDNFGHSPFWKQSPWTSYHKHL